LPADWQGIEALGGEEPAAWQKQWRETLSENKLLLSLAPRRSTPARARCNATSLASACSVLRRSQELIPAHGRKARPPTP